MSIKVFAGCRLFDGVSEEIRDGMHVLIENDKIREVSERPIASTTRLENVETIDCAGRFLMPGLLDLHFHAYSVSFDMRELDRMPKPLLVSYAIKHLEDAAQRGFTTVRDPGGGDIGLAMAIQQGLIAGPRFLFGGKALSQTGGHGDMRPASEEEPCHCAYSGVICQLADGVDEVRRIARDELRKGADHLKVFISGGVTSPHDPIWMPQFTDEELRAVVQEANSRRKYVIAHCHTDEGAMRCVATGIRSIDHATHITAPTAAAIAKAGAYIVPTLAVLQQIAAGAATGMQPDRVAKANGLLEQMLGSIEVSRRAGVKIGLGTDIFGTEFHGMQSSELRFRAEVDRPIDILRSATSINAEIAQLGAVLGQIAPGFIADAILLDANPIEDISVFERHRTQMPVVMKEGVFLRNQLR